jgi:hypothetical protein
MYALDLLEQAHQTALRSVEGLPVLGWHIPGVYGGWSVKDIFAHFIACEYVLLDIMASVMGSDHPPALDRWLRNRDTFYAVEIARRRQKMAEEVVREYKEAHAETVSQLIRIPDDYLRKNGMLPWYDRDADLEQFITYTFYHNKQDLCERIAAFRDQMLHVLSKEHMRRPDGGLAL